MSFVVKNTTINWLLDLVCPYSCRGCGHLGEVLCGCCKNNYIRQHKNICPLCKKVLGCGELKCDECELDLRMVAVAGWKDGVLGRIVQEYKYKSVRSAGDIMVELLDFAITEKLSGKEGWEEVVIVPLPTISRHVRERGFDHTLELAKKLARKRGWKVETLLVRAKDTVQVGAKASVRQKQAKEAYGVYGKVDDCKRYILLDDVWTTGASVLGAAKTLKDSGATDLSVAVVITTMEKKSDLSKERDRC